MTTDPEHGELVPLGDGPVATVLAGVDGATGEAFALKVFPGGLDRRTRADLDRELTRLAALRAHAPVLVADRVEERPDGRCALRMELCTQSLPELLDSFGPLSVADTLVLGTVLATALAAAHAAGLVHGGVLPGNVLFRPSGEPVLSDFGLTLRHAFPRDPLRTADLLPPETVRDGSADERSDLYGLGVVLYLALSGRSPHQGPAGEEPEARLLRVLGGPVPPLDRPGTPPELAKLISVLLARDPDARPDAASAVAEQLDALRIRIAPSPPDHQPPAVEQRGFDDFAASGLPGAEPPSPGTEPQSSAAAPNPETEPPNHGTEPPNPETEPPNHGTEPPNPETEPPNHGAEPPNPGAEPPEPGPEPPAGAVTPPTPAAGPPATVTALPTSAAQSPNPAAEVSSRAAPRPHGEPILVFGAEKPLRRVTRTRSVLIGVGGLVLLAAVAGPVLLNRTGELTVPPAPAQTGVASPATASPRVVRLELADPADRGNVVELSWQSSEPLDFAVIVAAEGERARALLAQRNTTYRVPVDPVRRYCFLIQGSDGNQVYESQPKPIRGANCVK
ncbi:serine/threonine protein kinase [Plantactinospora sp. KLBMP9567]|uniref:serine/threonine protein kinase n=1 Tax=Plantactinospora sp. KLBMP9567 TaxID=3085900 RepID=UPI0029819AFE|nr:protein kinase [Plantactinospora sp. KLBMP9567]MDW5327045.1 protein kinase [Plantactinospora sp. KLBMP9567]